MTALLHSPGVDRARTSASDLAAGVVRLSLAGFAFAIPLEASFNLPLIGTAGRTAGIVAFGAAIVAVLGGARVRAPCAIHGWIVAFLAWGALSYLWSADRTLSWVRVGTVIQLGLIPLLVWAFIRTTRQLDQLVWAYIGGTALAIADVLYTVINIDSLAVPEHPYGTVERLATAGLTVNAFGRVIVVAMVLSYFAARGRPPGWTRNLLFMSLVFFPVGLLLTGSRGALLTAVPLFAMVAVDLVRGSGRSIVSTLPVVAAALLLTSVLVPQDTRERIFDIAPEGPETTLAERQHFAEVAFDLFEARPAVGHGFGAYPTVAEPELGRPRAPHNSYTSVLAELGLVGFVLMGGVLLTAGLIAWHRPWGRRALPLVLLATLLVANGGETWLYSKASWFALAIVAFVPETDSAASRHPWSRTLSLDS